MLPFIDLALVKTKQFSTKYNKYKKLNLPTEVPGTNLNQNVQPLGSAGKHVFFGFASDWLKNSGLV